MLELPPANTFGFPSFGAREGVRLYVCVLWLTPAVSEEFGHALDVDLDWGAGPTAQLSRLSPVSSINSSCGSLG